MKKAENLLKLSADELNEATVAMEKFKRGAAKTKAQRKVNTALTAINTLIKMVNENVH
ncbi:MAG: hypothetical protein R6U37_00645 [Dehalococcoidia bacterium]